jgi:hypothetical protein
MIRTFPLGVSCFANNFLVQIIVRRKQKEKKKTRKKEKKKKKKEKKKKRNKETNKKRKKKRKKTKKVHTRYFLEPVLFYPYVRVEVHQSFRNAIVMIPNNPPYALKKTN